MTIEALSTGLTNFFRLTYETCETVIHAQNLPHGGRLKAPRLFMINKIAINGIDMVSTFLNVKGSKNSGLKIGLNIAEGGHRLIEICRGIYISKNLTRSKQAAAFQQIILELLNVARLGLNTLNIINNDNGLNSTLYGVFVDVSLLAVSLADSVFRIHSLFSQRIAIHKQLSSLAQNKTLSLIGRKLDYPGRVLGHTLCVVKSFSLGILCLAGNSLHALVQSGLKSHDPESYPTFKRTLKLLVFTQLLSCYYSKMINSCIDMLFSHFGVQLSVNSERAKYVFSIVASGFISMATAVGLGLHPSMKELISRTFVVSLSTLGVSTALFIGIISSTELFLNGNTFPSNLELMMTFLTTGLSLMLIFPTLVGTGLAPTLDDAYINGQHGLLFLCSKYQLNVFMKQLSRLMFNGPIDWKDIKTSLISLTD